MEARKIIVPGPRVQMGRPRLATPLCTPSKHLPGDPRDGDLFPEPSRKFRAILHLPLTFFRTPPQRPFSAGRRPRRRTAAPRGPESDGRKPASGAPTPSEGGRIPLRRTAEFAPRVCGRPAPSLEPKRTATARQIFSRTRSAHGPPNGSRGSRLPVAVFLSPRTG